MPINNPIDDESEYAEMFKEAMKFLEKDKDKKNTADDVSKIGEKVNNQDNKEAANNILVISEQDNLTHSYFYYFEHAWDAMDCMSYAILKIPKTDQKNINYWISYTGNITVYFGNNIKSEYKDKEKFVDKGGLKPIFTGEVSRVKEHYNYVEIQVASIGKRFKAKIPQEFRESFIYNQNVRDAFQAICEFLGVKYICPPKTTQDEDEEETDESANTDGNENNVNNKTATENKLAKTAVNKATNRAANNKKTNSSTKKTSTKNKTKKQKSNKNTTDKYKNISDVNGNNITDDSENSTEDEELSNNEEIDTPQNGYEDVSFDAAGNIVHGSVVIETSPDMAETLIAMEEHPFEKYTEDETGIVEDIQRLFAGELFEELHNNIMNYDSITIQPQASSSTTMGAVGATGATGATGASSASSGSGGGSSNRYNTTSSSSRGGTYRSAYNYKGTASSRGNKYNFSGAVISGVTNWWNGLVKSASGSTRANTAANQRETQIRNKWLTSIIKR